MPEMLTSNGLNLNLAELSYLLPEGLMALGLLVVMVLTLLTPKKKPLENQALMFVGLTFVSLAFGVLLYNRANLPSVSTPIMMNTLVVDDFAYLMRSLLLLGSGITIALAHRFLERNTHVVGDFYVLAMGATLGGMFLTVAADLVTVFIGLETLSIPSYILAGYLRRTPRSVEASFKYLVYGGMGTAIFLFGLSLVYGLAGSTRFVDIAQAMTQLVGTAGHPTLLVILVMVFAALAYKLSLAPFHMWAPDIYEGAPTPVSAFLSVVSKTAAFAVTIRLLVMLFGILGHWPMFFGILSVLSMTLGNFVALKQTNIKRLLAYSTVAHAGYMILALILGNALGLGSILYYLMTYLFMNLGAFAAVIYFSNLTGSDEIYSYSGLVQKRPGLVIALSICLLSLAGIPITSGFFAKFFLFQAVVVSNPGYLWLVIVALLNSTVSLAYYINIIRVMVVKEPSPAVEAIPTTRRSDGHGILSTAMTLCVVATLLLGIFAGRFFDYAVMSADQMIMNSQPAVVSQASGHTAR